MRLVLLGPPGAGKGTQGELLAEKLQIPRISTGDIFRAAIKNETELGKKAKLYVESGKLVPDAIVVGIVLERITQPDCEPGFLLDGFPRTVAQAEALAAELEQDLDGVILLELSPEEVVERLTKRRLCRRCGAIYHLTHNPPQEEGWCDRCGGQLYQRDDDREATIRNRLAVYEELTGPLRAYYQQKDLLIAINAAQPKEKVFSDICRSLGSETV
ncbi:MAG: adenylate kinase [bacterium]